MGWLLNGCLWRNILWRQVVVDRNKDCNCVISHSLTIRLEHSIAYSSRSVANHCVYAMTVSGGCCNYTVDLICVYFEAAAINIGVLDYIVE